MKDKDGNVDFAASKAKADEIYAQLKGGADFATLAKQNSADPGSKDTGGKLTISRGQTVPEFDKVSFELDDGRALEAGEDAVRLPRHRGRLGRPQGDDDPARQGASASIRTTLLQQKRNEAMQSWVEDLKKDYKGKVSYAAGYEPPALPDAPTERRPSRVSA